MDVQMGQSDKIAKGVVRRPRERLRFAQLHNSRLSLRMRRRLNNTNGSRVRVYHQRRTRRRWHRYSYYMRSWRHGWNSYNRWNIHRLINRRSTARFAFVWQMSRIGRRSLIRNIVSIWRSAMSVGLNLHVLGCRCRRDRSWCPR